MTEKISLARPYARAIFDIAKRDNAFDYWEKVLTALSLTLQHPRWKEIVKQDPKEAYTILLSILKACSLETKEADHFLSLLHENKRFILLPEILELFQQYYQAENNIQVFTLKTANILSDEEKKQFQKILEQQLQRKTEIEYAVEPEILAGFKLISEDTVLDTSLKNQLSQLQLRMGA